MSLKSMSQNRMNRIWNKVALGGVGLATVFASAAFGSVPKHVTNDTAIYQNLSEIKAKRQKELNFDRDIAQLASAEGRYKEHLPEVSRSRVSSPMNRISKKAYRYSTPSGHSRANRK